MLTVFNLDQLSAIFMSFIDFGFLLAFFQILSHKTDVFSLKSKLRRMQLELDNLRNQSIEDDMEIIDEMNDRSL